MNPRAHPAQLNVNDPSRPRQPQVPPPRPAKPPPNQSMNQQPAQSQPRPGNQPPPNLSTNSQSAPGWPLGAQRPAAGGPPGPRERLASPPPPLAARGPAVPGPPPGGRRPLVTSPPPVVQNRTPPPVPPLRRAPTMAASPPPANRPPPRAPPPPPPPRPAARVSSPSGSIWSEKRGADRGGPDTDTDVEHQPDGQSPYMKLLLSLDRIPRSHTIAVMLFTWLLLVGFVIVPGSFTSRTMSPDPSTQQQQPQAQPQRRQSSVSDNNTPSTVELPFLDASGQRLSLSPANTACLVLGFLFVLTGSFGAAWLALRWRRNHIWLLNKLYAPLVLNALAGELATVAAVYTQHGGEWCPQAVVSGVVEGVVFVVSLVGFLVYNQSLLRIVRRGGVMETKKKDKKGKKGGGLARFKMGKGERGIAPGSVI
ncbi:hypothetical protein VTJ49DRAFT_5634 [Mycothermus thermophilus]|uniref:Uncharacterized protein n=1 Tax=Humicola insolens TaxID=85995 RepID=A0ABR3V2V1_HUMIN